VDLVSALGSAADGGLLAERCVVDDRTAADRGALAVALHSAAVSAVREARARIIGRIQYHGDDLHDALALVRRCAHELDDLDGVFTLRVGSQAECDRACVRAWLAVDAWRRATGRA
jgi:hypothetical protein